MILALGAFLGVSYSPSRYKNTMMDIVIVNSLNFY